MRRQFRADGWRLTLAAALVLVAAGTTTAADEELAAARSFYLRGKYEESSEAYKTLVEKHPVAATIGLVRCLESEGSRDQAAKLLADGVKTHPKEARLAAERARLLLDRGDHAGAGEAAKTALALDPKSLLARWVAAELSRLSGDVKAADAAYKQFVDLYNAEDFKDPDDLRCVGLAAAQFARWHRLGDQFGFLVNTLYPEIVAANPDYWPAHYEAGMLYLEKYNQAEATKELKAALKINPAAAEVHAALAQLALQNYDMDDAQRSIDRALEINPNCIFAQQQQADLYLNNFQTEEAVKLLAKTRLLNPSSEETLGRLAACYVALDGAKENERFNKLVEEATKRNAHCGEFYFTLALRLSDRKKFNEAEPFFLEAIERLPQHTAARGELGLMLMRLGDEPRAEKLLKESFEIDPFNVRVSNMLKVLDVLAGYAVIETEHFVVKFDRGPDELLARYAADYLENEVYPPLTKQFGFEPAGKSLFEIFHKAKNTNGHGWFSARMVGLPYIGTVGACAGKMVAMASPNDMDQKFNWARVLKHEFVHVLNLQQTNFNIPHWFTEALAVINENYPRPELWNQLLASRVPKDDVFNLDTINLGFIRPKSSLDWQMAYCQAELYAEYMLKTHGENALAKMLDAYAKNLTTRAAIKQCFGVEQEEFERGYTAYVKEVAAGLSTGKSADKELTLAQLVKAQAVDPENPDLMAQLAVANLARKGYPEARELARKALKLKPQHQLASYAMARIHLLVGDNDEAIALLEGCLDPKAPDENVVNLLAGLKLKAEKFDDAAKLYELGARRDPSNSKWSKALARVYIATGDETKLAATLGQLAEADADELSFRKKLAQLAFDGKDYAAAAKWSRQTLEIDVQDDLPHKLLAKSLMELMKPAEAAAEFAAAGQLDPQDGELRLSEAKAWISAKQPQKARPALEKLLRIEADHAEAKQLLESLPK